MLQLFYLFILQLLIAGFIRILSLNFTLEINHISHLNVNENPVCYRTDLNFVEATAESHQPPHMKIARNALANVN